MLGRNFSSPALFQMVALEGVVPLEQRLQKLDRSWT